ncbi:MAG: flagellar basal body rod protein FlgB [Tepidanaerobacteraceae bacterium]|nr:flagellar basal body rod protein FlgB [Tepidanaerobacteraceae bacterium]
MDIFNNINLMEGLLDVKLKRHELLSNNLANVDTPGYKRSDITFESILRDNLNKSNIPMTVTNNRHIRTRKLLKDIQPKVYSQEDRSLRNDENNVDMDKEMVELIKNTLSYNIISDQIQKNFRILQTAISEGRK